MKFEKLPRVVLNEFFNNLNEHLLKNKPQALIKYVNLGSKIVRLLIYDINYLPHIERQMSFIIMDSAKEYDATIAVFSEDDVSSLPANLSKEFNPKYNLRLRVELLVKKARNRNLKIYDSERALIIATDAIKNSFFAYNNESNTYYFAVNDLHPEIFIKHGHMFVKIFYRISKTNNTSLVHGAVFGLQDKGVLFCARGCMGKSTLAVTSLIGGFQYVADDYLILEQADAGLYSYPVYSIVTLSPKMYNTLYDKLNVKFVSNNAVGDKYVFNVSKYHNNFKTRYPIKVCIFPEISDIKKPVIIKMDNKGKAIVQLVHSTIKQMKDEYDTKNVKKLINMLQDLEFYRFRLSSDIFLNTKVLRDFISNLKVD